MRVQQHPRGGYVVIRADHRDDTFVEARPATTPGFSHIEFVRGGRHMFQERVPTLRAPIRLIEIARGERL